MKTFKQIFQEAQNKIVGIAAAPGIIIAPVYLFSKEIVQVNNGDIEDIEQGLANLEEALAKSKKELNKIFSIAKEKMEEERAAIFEAHMMILDDPVLIDRIKERIEKEKKSPEFIVNDEINKYQQLMIGSKEHYMKERAHDIEDIYAKLNTDNILYNSEQVISYRANKGYKIEGRQKIKWLGEDNFSIDATFQP